MKSRKQKIAKKAKQGLRNYQRKLDYEIRLKQELGLEYLGFWRVPMRYLDFDDLKRRQEYFGDWNPDMPSMARDKVRTYHVTLHLAPLIHLGGETKNGFEGGTMVKTMTCLPSQVYEETRKLMQIVRLEHEVEVSEFYSYAVLRS